MAWRLRSSLRLRIAVAVLAASAAPFACGQTAAAATTAQTVVDVLHAMSNRAGIIFVGQVLAVRRSAASAGVVEVDLRVDEAIRGCSVGTYTLREWAGLWVVDDQRYHVGQRLLMLLHAPGASGLSSPVDGLDGAIPIRQGGSATPYVGDGVASARFVDLRWLGTKLPRGVSYRSESSRGAKGVLPPVPFVASPQTVVAVRSGAVASVGAIVPLSGDAVGGSVPAQQASVDAVVGMLTAWERAQHVAP